MSKFIVTEEMVLRCAKKAVRPDSIYINDEVRREHSRHVAAGGTGHVPRTSLVLRRLRALEAKGFITESRFATGHYGYRWTLTEAGREALNVVR
ncbi:MAG: hypothetical protein PBV01_10335 [Brucella anthropi]